MKKHILLIGDNKINNNIVQSIIKPHYKFDIVDSIDKLESFLSINNIDLILIDLNNQESISYNVIGSIREKEKFKFIPVIFILEKLCTDIEMLLKKDKNIDVVINSLDDKLMLHRVRLQIELSDYKFNIDKILEEKTKTIENLQDVMMMTIAELVECRDQTTGGHVKRTAKYVEVLVKALVERGIYSDILTPKYVKDMIRSAPLHDLGKIGIDDKTLLKNGSLDNREFEYMKTHSALGGEVIKKMIDETTEGSFLDVAKEMANYHHEKWDGTGYPEGLKGEEIPVSARVMAIADIYDALTTKRPYKEAFMHEDAVKIILSGRGTIFDPMILDVFKDIHLMFEEIKNNI